MALDFRVIGILVIPLSRTSGTQLKNSLHLDLKVQITELDVSIYTSRTDTVNMGFTPEREQKQIDLYKMAFKVFREKKKCNYGHYFLECLRWKELA